MKTLPLNHPQAKRHIQLDSLRASAILRGELFVALKNRTTFVVCAACAAGEPAHWLTGHNPSCDMGVVK